MKRLAFNNMKRTTDEFLNYLSIETNGMLDANITDLEEEIEIKLYIAPERVYAYLNLDDFVSYDVQVPITSITDNLKNELNKICNIYNTFYTFIKPNVIYISDQPYKTTD